MSENDPAFKKHFEKPYKKIDKDFYMCLGNHDYSYPDLSIEYQKSPEHQINYSSISKKWKMPSNYYKYSFEIDKSKSHRAEFFVMDTNIDRMTIKEKRTQMKYLIDSINNSTAHWKILYGHHPWRSVHGHGHAEIDLEKYFRELVYETRKNPIDLYMCGHDHNKQYLEINLKITSKAQIKIPLIVCGTAGKINTEPVPPLENSKTNDYFLHFFSNTLGFLCVKIFYDNIDIYMFDATGKNVEFQKTIQKQK